MRAPCGMSIVLYYKRFCTVAFGISFTFFSFQIIKIKFENFPCWMRVWEIHSVNWSCVGNALFISRVIVWSLWMLGSERDATSNESIHVGMDFVWRIKTKDGLLVTKTIQHILKRLKIIQFYLNNLKHGTKSVMHCKKTTVV